MTEARISGQYYEALFIIFDPPVMQKLATEEFITEKILYTLDSLIIIAESQKLILSFSMSNCPS